MSRIECSGKRTCCESKRKMFISPEYSETQSGIVDNIHRRRNHTSGMFTRLLWFCIFAELLLIQVTSVQCSVNVQELIQTFLEKKFPDYRNLEGLTIVHPIQVDSAGTFISHHIAPSRRKRGLGDDPSAGLVHYRLTANDQNFHLELRPNELLLAPSFTIQRRWRDYSIRQEYIPELDNCHYHGNLPSHPSSSAAVSLCDGMVGLLRTASDDYLIEPLPSHLENLFNQTTTSSSPQSRPHIIYKRSLTSSAPPTTHSRNDTRTKKGKIHQHYCGRRKKYQPHPPPEPIFFMDEYPSSGSNRSKRSLVGDIHQNRFVETLVVVDPPMVRNHSSEKIATYVLSVMNIVANLYRDTSLGNTVNIVVVNLILLEEDQPGLRIEYHADRSLNSFCQWQSTLALPNGTRHDHAILLTGKDICSWKNEPCDTLGYAPIGGMCSKYRSCTINEDTGIGLAFTIAHESGHSFSMVHDGDNGCRKQGGNIMSSTLSGHTGRFTWSACSSTSMDEFLQSQRASCTENEPLPSQAYVFPSSLPGELYSADQQCQWQFGAKARLCSFNFGKSLCKAIWCHRGERRCETKFLPAADGTPCGSGLWCIQGECIPRGEKGPPPIDGGWGEYGAYRDCSTTCGQGVQFKVRACDNPPPQNGGKYCEGPSKIYQLCNIQECTEPSDFRAQQCAMYNSRPFRGYYYEWKPYTYVPNFERCKLYCMADGFSFYFALAAKVVDGTRCDGDSRDICVNGKCEHVGCDNVLGSSAKHDSCGVCEGDNSTCQFVSGTYVRQFVQNDYYEVVDIPAGARHIRIAEDFPSDSYLALRNARFQYYITGSWMVDWPGDFHIAGTVFTYKRPYGTPESLSAPGPTTEDLVVEILLRDSNPGIHYEYVIPAPIMTTTPPPPRPVYAWNITVTQCSASCGGGVKRVIVDCVEDNITVVNDSFCAATPKPIERFRLCGQVNCPAVWMTSRWKACNQNCGGGLQKRSVFCIKKMGNGRNKTVKNKHCKADKPRRWQSCNVQDCPTEWHTEAWSECSRTCGDGFKERTVTCVSRSPSRQNIEKEQGECSHLVKPKTRLPCDLGRCPLDVQWFISAWGSCSTTCGPGEQTRIIKCSHLDDQGQYRELPEEDCAHLDRPGLAVTKVCERAECVGVRERGQWTTGQWTPCSVSCGGGTQSRVVLCIGTGTGNQVECDENRKPSKTQICSTDTCSSRGTGRCIDEYPWCNLVPSYGMCDHQFYGRKCCYACRNANT